MKDILIENLMSKYSKLYESFWSPCPEFQEFEKLWTDMEDSIPFPNNDWNKWSQQQRDMFADEVTAEYLKTNPNPSQDFFDDLEDNNYHTAYKSFERALKGRVNESCGKKSKKLKESMKEIDRKYFASLNKEEDGHYYILIDGTYEKDFYADSDEEAKKKFQQYLRKNESLKESKDSKDELYKKIVGYVKKYDSGELDIDETAKQILDFWKKSSEDNLNKDIDTAVKKTNESLLLKEEKNKEVDEYISKLLNKIKDSGLQQVIRDAIFRGNVDKKFLLDTICQNMPEQKKEIEKLGLKESFWTGSRWQKRIARYDEFNNGNVFYSDWITVPDEEAEEMARQASIETPNKVFFVQYDDPMAEPSPNRYINGKVYDSSAPECIKFGKFSR